MSLRRIKTAIVGCGKAGHIHANCYQRLETSELVGAVGTRPGRGEAFGREYGVPGFDSLRELVEKTGVEAVSICTPHPNHTAHAVEAARLGLHIAVENPLAASLADCDSTIRAAAEAGVVGTSISQRRFYLPAQRVRRAIEEGRIGKPILGTVTMLGRRGMDYCASDPWRGTWAGEGGGVLVNQAPHQLDLLLWYMGDIEELYGMWGTLNHPELEVEDTAVAVIRFRNGALGNIVVSNSQNPALYGNVHIYGENGAAVGVQTDSGAKFIAGVTGIAQPPVNDLWTVKGEEGLLEKYRKEDSAFFGRVDMHYHHCEQLRDFLGAIQRGRAPLVTLADGRRTVELFTAVYRSQREKRAVRFPLER